MLFLCLASSIQHNVCEIIHLICSHGPISQRKKQRLRQAKGGGVRGKPLVFEEVPFSMSALSLRVHADGQPKRSFHAQSLGDYPISKGSDLLHLIRPSQQHLIHQSGHTSSSWAGNVIMWSCSGGLGPLARSSSLHTHFLWAWVKSCVSAPCAACCTHRWPCRGSWPHLYTQMPVYLHTCLPLWQKFLKMEPDSGAPLVAQWLRLRTSSVALGSTPGQGTRSHMLQPSVHMLQLNIRHAATKITDPARFN